MRDYSAKKDLASGEYIVLDGFGQPVRDPADSSRLRSEQKYLYFANEAEAKQAAKNLQLEYETATRAEEERIACAQRASRAEREAQQQREADWKRERQEAYLFDSKLHGLIVELDSASAEARKIREEVNSLTGRLQAKTAALNAVEKCITDLQDLIDKHKAAKAAGETK